MCVRACVMCICTSVYVCTHTSIQVHLFLAASYYYVHCRVYCVLIYRLALINWQCWLRQWTNRFTWSPRVSSLWECTHWIRMTFLMTRRWDIESTPILLYSEPWGHHGIRDWFVYVINHFYQWYIVCTIYIHSRWLLDTVDLISIKLMLHISLQIKIHLVFAAKCINYCDVTENVLRY